jgi:hypothetical protein
MRTITRRTVLKGLGTAMALPFLEAMTPKLAFGSTTPAKAIMGPRRVAWVYVPNGITMEAWTPAEVGSEYTSTRILDPIKAFRDRTLVVTGLNCDKANANGDGPGDHARAMAAYLTGAQPKKNQGSDIRVGISADQAVAERVGHLTKFASLEIGTYEGQQVGGCDSGYACAYNANLSWKNATTPVAKDVDPRSVFDRLFGNGNGFETEEAKAKRLARKKSVLDFVLEDARSLNRSIGAADKRKVDEYLASVRTIEERLNNTEPSPIPEGATRPGELPPIAQREFPTHCKLMIDMMVLAFQGDLTRVIAFPFTNELSAQKYPWADADVTHHGNSHHMRNAEKIEFNTRINVFHMQQFAYLLERLDAIKEANGSVLDNSLIAYGSGVSDGDRHNHDNLPFLLVGKGGGTVSTGKHIRVNKEPINNMWCAMADRMGAKLDNFGDATGILKI